MTDSVDRYGDFPNQPGDSTPGTMDLTRYEWGVGSADPAEVLAHDQFSGQVEWDTSAGQAQVAAEQANVPDLVAPERQAGVWAGQTAVSIEAGGDPPVIDLTRLTDEPGVALAARDNAPVATRNERPETATTPDRPAAGEAADHRWQLSKPVRGAIEHVRQHVAFSGHTLSTGERAELSGERPVSVASFALLLQVLDHVGNTAQAEPVDASAADWHTARPEIDADRSLADQLREDRELIGRLVDEAARHPSGVWKELMTADINGIVQTVNRYRDRAGGMDAVQAVLERRTAAELGLPDDARVSNREATRDMPGRNIGHLLRRLGGAEQSHSRHGVNTGAARAREAIFEYRIAPLNEEYCARVPGAVVGPMTLERALAVAAASMAYRDASYYESSPSAISRADPAKPGLPEYDPSAPIVDIKTTPEWSILEAVEMVTHLAVNNHYQGQKNIGVDGQRPELPEEVRTLEAQALNFRVWLEQQYNPDARAMAVLLNGVTVLGAAREQQADATERGEAYADFEQGRHHDLSDAWLRSHIERAGAIRALGARMRMLPEIVADRVGEQVTEIRRQLGAANPDRQRASSASDLVIGMTPKEFDQQSEAALRSLFDRLQTEVYGQDGPLNMEPDRDSAQWHSLMRVQERLAAHSASSSSAGGARRELTEQLAELGKIDRERAHPAETRIHVAVGREQSAAFYAGLVAELGAGHITEFTTEGVALSPGVRTFTGNLSKGVDPAGEGVSYPRQSGTASRVERNRANIIIGKTPVGLRPHELLDITADDGVSGFQDMLVNEAFYAELRGLLANPAATAYHGQFTVIEVDDPVMRAVPFGYENNGARSVWVFRNQPDGSPSRLLQAITGHW